MEQISFVKATIEHLSTILNWLDEEHVKEFWDSSQAHKDDIVNFIEGRKTPSKYCDGHYVYWVGQIMTEPFCLIMSIEETKTGENHPIKIAHISETGTTYSLDYMIGNIKYVGKGLAAKTLKEFILFFEQNYDDQASRFLIDPAFDNQRARHVYEKAGFRYVGDFIMGGSVSGSGKIHNLLVLDIIDS